MRQKLAIYSILFLALSCFAIPPGIAADPFPDNLVQNRTGINTGIETPWLNESDYKKISQTGIQHVRLDLLWHRVERESGVYQWDEFDTVFKKLRNYQLKPLIILAYNNRLYDRKAGGIRTEKSRTGFGNFAAAAVARYNKKIPGTIWEIWNEPNTDVFWSPGRDAKEYMALLNVSVRAMRAADPTVTIINGGFLDLSWGATKSYLESCLKLGLLELVDGLAIHLYSGHSNVYPERIIQELHYLRRRLQTYGASMDFPILNTEFGASTEEFGVANGLHSRGEETRRAEIYVRMHLLCLLQDIRLNVWYEWRRGRHSSKHAILNSDGTSRKTFDAIKILIEELENYSFSRRVDGFGADNYILEFHKDGQKKIVAWTAGKELDINLPVRSHRKSFATLEMMGKRRAAIIHHNKLSIRLTGAPKYIKLGTAIIETHRQPAQ